ncbi:MAG TPA: hypothetical protein PK899_11035, partial [Spirochaetota bacterium]|nr:hypothetical protein [Spirochaetota bacterium]
LRIGILFEKSSYSQVWSFFFINMRPVGLLRQGNLTHMVSRREFDAYEKRKIESSQNKLTHMVDRN